MGLENTFGKVEKPAKEKRLEVITSKEATIKDLEDYFEKNKYGRLFFLLDRSRKYFSSCMNFLQSFELTPGIISEFNTKIGNIKEKEAFGLYLSALIQTSYNQDHNNFVFEEVNAAFFGAFLQGQPEKPIKITTKTQKGVDSLYRAENCSLTTETLNGDCNLWHADGCVAEITKYQGTKFGYGMNNCTIKSGNEKTLELIENQVREGNNNKFELIK